MKSDLGQLIDKLDPKEKEQRSLIIELYLLDTARTIAELMATIEEQQELLTALSEKKFLERTR